MTRVLDVSDLPTAAIGHRDPAWWGVALLLVIETTMFSLLVASYFYVRGFIEDWPPTGAGRRAFIAAAVGGALLVASIPVMRAVARAARRKALVPARRALWVTTLLAVAALVARGLEMKWLAFRWDLHAHASIAWFLLGMHTFHEVIAIGENLVLLAVLHRGPLENKHYIDLDVNALYWAFVAGAWLPLYGIYYLDELVRR